MEEQEKGFKMSYLVLDTNILLLDAANLTSAGGDSVVVIPETVLAELDNYQEVYNNK